MKFSVLDDTKWTRIPIFWNILKKKNKELENK